MNDFSFNEESVMRISAGQKIAFFFRLSLNIHELKIREGN